MNKTSTKVLDLPIPEVVRNRILALGFSDISQFESITASYLYKVQGLGRVSMAKIKYAMDLYGYKFKEQPSFYTVKLETIARRVFDFCNDSAKYKGDIHARFSSVRKDLEYIHATNMKILHETFGSKGA